MQSFRLKSLTNAALLVVFASPSLLACGGWSEEAPPTLDVYLDRLPAKSLGQIFVETMHPSTPEASPSINDAVRSISDRAKTEPTEKLIAEVDHLLALVRADNNDHESLALLHDLRDGLAGPRKTGQVLMRVLR